MADDKKMTPPVGQDMGGRDPVARMLDQAEKGQLGGTLRQSRPEGNPIIRPFQAPPRDYSTPPSKAPRGMANSVEGDIGAYRQQEAGKVFKKFPGKDISNPLSYRKPETAIDAKYGPGDRIC